MELIFITCCVLVFLLILFFKRAVKGPKRTVKQLKRPIDDLLKRGFQGATLVIEHTSSPRFLQFAKYIHGKGVYGVEMGFPRAEWSKHYYDEVKAYCKLHEIRHIEETAGDGSDDMLFLNVDCGKNSKVAYELTSQILLSIFELTEADTFFVRLDNASTEDLLIDQKN